MEEIMRKRQREVEEAYERQVYLPGIVNYM
jgi:hypothetical protein